MNDSNTGILRTSSLSDDSLAKDAAKTEADIAEGLQRIADASTRLHELRAECATYVEKAAQFDASAANLDAGLASAFRSGGDVDALAQRAGDERAKAAAARRAEAEVQAEIKQAEATLFARQQAFGAAERDRAGILFRAVAQEFARDIAALRPKYNAMAELARLAQMSLHEGTGLLPNYAIPEIAGIRFDLTGI